MDSLDLIFRYLTAVFWLSAAATLAWLALSTSGLVGESPTIFAALTMTVAACSGLLLWREWRDNPVEDSEYGEWTNMQLLYAIAFAISFFVGFLSLANWYFSA